MVVLSNTYTPTLTFEILSCAKGPQYVLCKAKNKDVATMTHLVVSCPDGITKMKMLAFFAKVHIYFTYKHTHTHTNTQTHKHTQTHTQEDSLLGSAMVFCKNKKSNPRDPVSIETLSHRDPEIRDRHKFSEVLSTVPLYRKYTRTLTFENFLKNEKAGHAAIAAWRVRTVWSARIPGPEKCSEKCSR
jgi:hypothetical protein